MSVVVKGHHNPMDCWKKDLFSCQLDTFLNCSEKGGGELHLLLEKVLYWCWAWTMVAVEGKRLWKVEVIAMCLMLDHSWLQIHRQVSLNSWYQDEKKMYPLASSMVTAVTPYKVAIKLYCWQGFTVLFQTKLHSEETGVTTCSVLSWQWAVWEEKSHRWCQLGRRL